MVGVLTVQCPLSITAAMKSGSIRYDNISKQFSKRLTLVGHRTCQMQFTAQPEVHISASMANASFHCAEFSIAVMTAECTTTLHNLEANHHRITLNPEGQKLPRSRGQ